MFSYVFYVSTETSNSNKPPLSLPYMAPGYASDRVAPAG